MSEMNTICAAAEAAVLNFATRLNLFGLTVDQRQKVIAAHGDSVNAIMGVILTVIHIADQNAAEIVATRQGPV